MPHHSEADLARGFALEALPGVAPRLAVAMVDLTEPGCFRRESRDGGPPELMQALAAGATFERAAPTLAPVGFAMPLAAALAEGETAQVQARRARVGEGEPLALALPPGTPITCDVADGGAAVVELEATAGEPVVGFLDGRGTVGPSSAWAPTSGGRVLSAKSAGKGRAVELWNSGASTVEARLSGWIATSAPAERHGWGGSRAVVGMREVLLLDLPAGEKDLRLTLAPGTAVLALAPPDADAEDDAESLIWAPVDAKRSCRIFGDGCAPSFRPAASRNALSIYWSFSRSGGRSRCRWPSAPAPARCRRGVLRRRRREGAARQRLRGHLRRWLVAVRARARVCFGLDR
jgi:hypothetical protein